MSNVKVGLVQMSCVKETATNLEKAIREIKVAASKGANIVCLQELFTSLYFCDVEDYDNFALAEPLYSTSFIAFSALAKELGVVIIVPFFEKRMAGIYHNSAYIIDSYKISLWLLFIFKIIVNVLWLIV